MKARVRACSDAAKDHRCDARAYAHVFHRRGVICVAPALLRLPLNYSLAIILHELGHLVLGDRGTECDADRAGARLARVSIQRRTYGKQHRLEFLPSRDLARARAAVLRLTDLAFPGETRRASNPRPGQQPGEYMLWRYGRSSGLWHDIFTVPAHQKTAGWLKVWRADYPGSILKIAKRRPVGPPKELETVSDLL